MSAVTERHVQAIWYDAALRPRRLRTRRGSEVTVVDPGEWNLGAGPDFRNAVLEIGDNGPGVSPHEIEYIFESYYRGDPSRTNPTTGSGLGLSIVKTIITAHDGTVQAVNDNGLKIIIKIPQRRKRN